VTTLVQSSINQERMAAMVVTLFGVLALLLAALGLYGVMAYTTASRTNEFGLRMALGARPSDVTRSVMQETMLMVFAGALFGVPASLFAARLLRSQLYEVGAIDLVSILVAVVVLGSSALLAGLLPAVRAARVPPLRALQSE
jgi:ABC-type antimicrobial peptide transport system permease subunit